MKTTAPHLALMIQTLYSTGLYQKHGLPERQLPQKIMSDRRDVFLPAIIQQKHKSTELRADLSSQRYLSDSAKDTASPWIELSSHKRYFSDHNPFYNFQTQISFNNFLSDDENLSFNDFVKTYFGQDISAQELLQVFTSDKCEFRLHSFKVYLDQKMPHLKIDAAYTDEYGQHVGHYKMAYEVRRSGDEIQLRKTDSTMRITQQKRGLGSELARKNLEFHYNSPNVVYSSIVADEIGVYAWRKIRLPFTESSRESVLADLDYLNDRFQLGLTCDEISSVKCPADVCLLVSFHEMTDELEQFAREACSHFNFNDEKLFEIIRHPSLLALLLVGNYEVFWDSQFKQNNPDFMLFDL